MLPLRLVIDTNVIVSAALKPESHQRSTFLLAVTKPARLYVSRPILEEYADVLSRRELGIRKGIRLQLLQLIKNHSHIVAPIRRLEVASDPDLNPASDRKTRTIRNWLKGKLKYATSQRSNNGSWRFLVGFRSL